MMLDVSYLVVSSIKDTEENSVGYRLVDIKNKKFMDISAQDLMQGIMLNSSQFVNVSVNYMGMLCFATNSKTDMELPALSLSGRRLLTRDAYTVGYSDARGNIIAYNAHGEKIIVQPREYLSGLKTFTNAELQNGGLVGVFRTARIDKDYFRCNRLEVPSVYGMMMSY